MSAPLHFREAGNRDAAPLILLHSITANGEAWAQQMPVWAQHFRVIAFDLPGHGQSPMPKGTPDIAVYADAVAESCAAMGIESANFLGLSLGSMTVQRLAATRPDLVRAAVLSNGICTTVEHGRHIWQDRIAGAKAGGIASLIQPTLDRWFTSAFREASPLTMGWVGAMIGGSSLEGYLFAAETIIGLDNMPILGQVQCPTLVLAGDEDATAAPPAALKAMADAIPGAKYQTLPAAHLANIELPALYAETVGRFLLESWT